MSDELIPTWGYHHKGGPKLFNLRAGESLPKGYSDTPYPPKSETVVADDNEQQLIEEETGEDDA